MYQHIVMLNWWLNIKKRLTPVGILTRLWNTTTFAKSVLHIEDSDKFEFRCFSKPCWVTEGSFLISHGEATLITMMSNLNPLVIRYVWPFWSFMTSTWRSTCLRQASVRHNSQLQMGCQHSFTFWSSFMVLSFFMGIGMRIYLLSFTIALLFRDFGIGDKWNTKVRVISSTTCMCFCFFTAMTQRKVWFINAHT